MKILLINPRFNSFRGAKDEGYERGFAHLHVEPLGLAYIAAVVEQSERHSVDVIDCIGLGGDVVDEGDCLRMGLSDGDFDQHLSNRSFNCIGITLTQEFVYGEKSLRPMFAHLKNRFPDAPIILGGPTATLEWAALIQDPNVDVIVKAEGEGTIIELLDALEDGKNLSEVAGIVYKGSEGDTRTTPDRPPYPIDELPLPARHLLPMEGYKKHRAMMSWSRTPALGIYTSRACPFSCNFCNLFLVWGQKWRGRNAKLVVDEMQHIVETYGVNRILVHDSNFGTKKKRVEDICDEIIRRGLKIDWYPEPGYMLHLLDEKLLKKLRAAGMYQITAQVESGSPKTLKYIKKPLDLNHARKMIKLANRLGMIMASNIIIGFKDETREDIEESISNAESLHIDETVYLTPFPLKNTSLHEDYLREGLIDDGPEEDLEFPVKSHHMTGEEINQMMIQANKNHRNIRLKQLLSPAGIFNELLPKIFSQSEKLILELRRRIVRKDFGITTTKYNLPDRSNYETEKVTDRSI
jgi:magnesium-protoporphyrin IX monomethyl ester (oxidative) cyclase